MCYHAIMGIDHIGDAVLADFHLRHQVPDQLEIDVGDAHPRVPACAGKRNCHIRLRWFLPRSRFRAEEINRTVVDLLGHRLGEFRVLRIVGLGPDHIHRVPGYFQLFDAGGVDLGKLRDR